MPAPQLQAAARTESSSGLRGLATGAGWAIVILGGATLAGWMLGIEALRAFGPGAVAMNPSTALGFVLAGLSLAIAGRGRRFGWALTAAATGGAAAGLLGLLRLLGYLSILDAGVDTWFAPSAAVIASRARMGATTALGFVLAGSGLGLLGRSSPRLQAVASPCLLGAGLLGAFGLVAHSFGASALHGSMATTTATGLLVLGAGALSIAPRSGLLAILRSDGPGGLAARGLLPLVGGVLLVFGLIFAGLMRRGWISWDVGVALLVATSLVALSAAVGGVAGGLDRAFLERRRAEEAQKASEARYQVFFDLIPLPTWIFDRETLAFLAVNKAAVESYGYSQEEFLELTLMEIRPREDVEALLEEVASIVSGDPSNRIWRHSKRDGTVIEVEITAASVTFGDRAARIVVARDVTEQRRTTHQLLASEQRFRTLAQTATDAIVSADDQGEITYLNHAAEHLFGMTVERAVGRSVAVLMPERFREAHRRGLQRYLTTGEANVIGKTVELAALSAHGREFPVELSLASWDTGERIAFTAVLRDISARRAAEEALRGHAAELEAANAELDAFSYSVSHDLRAPLRAIDGFSLVLLEDYSEQLDEQGRDYLARMRAAAQRMAALIDDLLKLARISRSEVRQQPVDLGAVARQVVRELRRREPDRVVDVFIGENLVAHGDKRLLRIALENLLENAWKYTRPTAPAIVEVDREPGEGTTAFRVKDNGVGFDMAYAKHLFAPFRRFHRPGDFEGTGIGLATVQRIIRRHGGRLWAEAQVGRGATFYFTLK